MIEAQQELAIRTARAWAGLQPPGGVGSPDPERPPRPGDLFLFGEGLDPAIEWLVLEVSGGLAFVIPADAVPLVGSRDLAISADAPCGPLTLRCGSGLWIEGDLAPGERTGTLASADLERALRARGAAESGQPTTAIGREVDEEAGYLEHMEEVDEVRAALARNRGSDAHTTSGGPATGGSASSASPDPLGSGAAGSEGGAGSKKLAFEGRADRSPGPRLDRLWPLAAVLLLVATLGLWSRNARLAERLAELESPALPRGNVPVAWLLGDLRAGAPEAEVELPGEGVPLVLVLRAPEGGDAGTEYELEARRRGSETGAWVEDGLRDPGTGELTLVVPRRAVEAGVYELALRRPPPGGAGSAAGPLVMFYTFELVVADDPEAGSGEESGGEPES